MPCSPIRYGATFGIYTPAQSGPQPAVGQGQFVWHELTTSDVEAALGFYRALFGWGEMHRMDMGAQGPYVIFGSDGTQRGGVYRSPPGDAGGVPLAGLYAGSERRRDHYGGGQGGRARAARAGGSAGRAHHDDARSPGSGLRRAFGQDGGQARCCGEEAAGAEGKTSSKEAGCA